MTAPEVELRAAWLQLGGSGHEHLLQQVLAHHREPHRRYHTAVHVMWVLRHVAELAAAQATPLDVPALQLAALYHDIVYDPRATDNEARSAVLARQAAVELGWPADRADLVHRWVEATAHRRHDAPAAEHVDAHEAVLLDADLAILGAAPAEYQAYVHGVRAEYQHVPASAWRTGRAEVLRGFLARPQLFLTATMRAARESRARANLTAELATLTS
jgi:predicted metal-dependent HD superfamily phosphohydrolase